MQRIKEDGVPKKLVSLVRRWYKNVRVKVRVNDVESDWFDSKVGVKQEIPYHLYFLISSLMALLRQ